MPFSSGCFCVCAMPDHNPSDQPTPDRSHSTGGPSPEVTNLVDKCVNEAEGRFREIFRTELDRKFKGAPDAVRQQIEESIVGLEETVRDFRGDIEKALGRYVAQLRLQTGNSEQITSDITSKLTSSHIGNATLEDLLGEHLKISDIYSLSTNAALVAPASPFEGVRASFFGIPETSSLPFGVSSESFQCIKTWYQTPNGVPGNEQMVEFDIALNEAYRTNLRRLGGVSLLNAEEVIPNENESETLSKILKNREIAVIPIGDNELHFGHIVLLLQKQSIAEGLGLQPGTDVVQFTASFQEAERVGQPAPEGDPNLENNARTISKLRFEHLRNAAQAALMRAIRVEDN